jgi:hypothetical protein
MTNRSVITFFFINLAENLLSAPKMAYSTEDKLNEVLQFEKNLLVTFKKHSGPKIIKHNICAARFCAQTLRKCEVGAPGLNV